MSPNFLIVGPPKCASTSLHFYFDQHPQIFVPAIKETNFFTRDYEKGIPFYEKYFSNAGKAKAIGEATPAYCFLPFACDRIKFHYPDIKLILCIRNPIERAFSHWLMLWARGTERAGFREAVEINYKQLSFMDFAGNKGAELWNERTQNINKGEKWPRIYLQPGMYGDMIKRLQAQFGQKQLYYYFMDDLKKDFDSTLKKIFAFIEVDNSFQIPERREKNVYKDRRLYKLVRKVFGKNFTNNIGKIISPSAKNFFNQKKQNTVHVPPQLKLEDRQFLWHVFKHDIAALEQITKRDLSHWNPL
jgi:hypothetical protein